MADLDFGETIKGFSPGQKVFTRYTLKRILGRGGMGVVWLARDDKLEREVALKFLPEVVVLDPKAIDELKREAKRNLDLTHPHIVRIYDFVDDARSAAIAMEYVDGTTLSKHSLEQPGGCFAPAQLEAWVRQLCGALDYAHDDARVVHRDLKPANLMLDTRGRVKITDFGIARSISDSVSRVSAQAGTSGTPVYMSPQQMMGDKTAVTDDIYALGATLYELITGKPPFHSGNIILQVQSKVPPSLAERRRDLEKPAGEIPAAWEETIAACLAKEPKDRPQTAGEVAERLGLAAKGNVQRATSNVQPPASSPTGAAATPQRTDRAGVAATSGQSEIRNPKSKIGIYAGLAAGVILLAGLGWYFGMHVPEQKRLAEIARLEAEKKSDEADLLRTKQEKSVADAKRLANARGGLVIRTNPSGAEVRVGAIALEKSPLTLKDQKLGKYPVRVRLDGYEEWTGELEVKENDFADLDVSLLRSTGKVVLSGPAGATVTAEGRTLGTLPLTLDRVPTGAVRYSLSLQGYKSAELSGEVSRNSELRLSAVLQKQIFPQPGQPWENTLGQKFVPLPGTIVLFCIWETRVQDFEAFVRETGHDATQGMYSDRGDGFKQQGDTWKSPGFPQSSVHPVVGVNHADAVAFCVWLTKQERAAGRLAPDQEYRLPTDAEWDAAVGKEEFPWGSQWTPPRGAGNYADESAKRGRYKNWSIISGYDDGYDATAPVGSYAANRYAIHDLGGNVWERIGDRQDGLRGASFNDGGRSVLACSLRVTLNFRSGRIGFRVVCAVVKETASRGSYDGNTYDLKEVDTPPVIRTNAAPNYPAQMRRAGIAGSVTVQFVVDGQGAVVSATAIQSTNKGFEAAALEAVQKYKFTPGMKDGRAVRVRLNQVVKFNLED